MPAQTVYDVLSEPKHRAEPLGGAICTKGAVRIRPRGDNGFAGNSGEIEEKSSGN